MDFCASQIKFNLLLRDPGAHVLDNRSIFSPQPLELHHLFCQVAASYLDDPASLHTQICDSTCHRRSERPLALAHDALAKRIFQRRQATEFQQRGIVCHFRHEALLRRNWNHLLSGYAQNLSGGRLLTFNLMLNLSGRAQGIPQRVDLIEDHQPCAHTARIIDEMLAPD